MYPLDRLRRRLATDRWRYGTVGGLLAIPGLLGSFWHTGDTMDGGWIVVGALIAGYLYAGDRETTKAVGFRAGLVATPPALWLVTDAFASGDWGGLSPVGSVAIGLLFLAVAAAMNGFVGIIAAIGGEWLAGKSGRRRRSPAAEA